MNPRRLHIGCGGAPRDGWLNLDRRVDPRVQICADLMTGIPLPDGDVDYAVAVHVLQEIPFHQLVPVLREIRRVLRPAGAGVLRLALPDLLKGVDACRRGDRAYFEVPDEDAASLGAKLCTQVMWYGHSRCVFTPDFAEELLRRAGFAKAAPCEYHRTASPYADITALDDRPKETFFIEGFT